MFFKNSIMCVCIYMCIFLLFSHSVMSDFLQPYGLQHVRLPCPSLSPGVCSNSCPLSPWCHPTISSSFSPFSSCPQSFPESESFPVSQLFALSGQRFMCMYMFVFILLSLIIVKYALWCLAHLPQPQPIDKSLLIAKRDLVQQRKSTIATRKSAQNLFPAEDESGKAWNKKAQRPAWSHGNLFLELQLVCARTCEPKVCVLWALIISMFTFETFSCSYYFICMNFHQSFIICFVKRS